MLVDEPDVLEGVEVRVHVEGGQLGAGNSAVIKVQGLQPRQVHVLDLVDRVLEQEQGERRCHSSQEHKRGPQGFIFLAVLHGLDIVLLGHGELDGVQHFLLVVAKVDECSLGGVEELVLDGLERAEVDGKAQTLFEETHAVARKHPRNANLLQLVDPKHPQVVVLALEQLVGRGSGDDRVDGGGSQRLERTRHKSGTEGVPRRRVLQEVLLVVVEVLEGRQVRRVQHHARGRVGYERRQQVVWHKPPPKLPYSTNEDANRRVSVEVVRPGTLGPARVAQVQLGDGHVVDSRGPEQLCRRPEVERRELVDDGSYSCRAEPHQPGAPVGQLCVAAVAVSLGCSIGSHCKQPAVWLFAGEWELASACRKSPGGTLPVANVQAGLCR